MSIRSTITISVCLLFLISPKEKKEQLLKLSKKYFPENYIVLKEYDEASIDNLAEGNSLKEYIDDVPTIVHEGYHSYFGDHSSYYDTSIIYRINDSLSFGVKKIKTFPAREINSIVPDSLQKKIFRYETYVDNNSETLVTQQFGILGLLEESVAYFQSYHTGIALFKYYNDEYGWKDPTPWMEYLGKVASYRFAIAEFQLFISWYLQYAKFEYPPVYNSITSNRGLKKLVSFLHSENKKLAAQYDTNRQEILKRFKGRLEVKNDFIMDNKNLAGQGLYDDEVKELNALLALPEHNDYRKLLQ